MGSWELGYPPASCSHQFGLQATTCLSPSAAAEPTPALLTSRGRRGALGVSAGGMSAGA